MVCRHSPGDPNCSSQNPKYGQATQSSVDSSKYEIIDVHRVGKHLVLKVKYPSCTNCAYEGVKVMVFLNVSEKEVIMWKKIDPHFRDPKSKNRNEAPSPAARFPATSQGWEDAIKYASEAP